MLWASKKIESCEHGLARSQNDRAECVTNKMSHMPCETLRSVVRFCGVEVTVTCKLQQFLWAVKVIIGLHGHFLTFDNIQ